MVANWILKAIMEGVEAEDLLTEFIKKEGSKYVVYSHQTGKKFGSYNSRGAAKKRLQQMHAFSGK